MYKKKLAQYLGRYIKGLSPENVKSRLLDGELELKDVELDVAPIGDLLAGVLPYTLEVVSVAVDSVCVQAPWRALKSRPVRVRVGSCRARVRVHAQADEDWARSAAERARRALAEAAAKVLRRGVTEISAASPGELKVVIPDGLEVSVESVVVELVSSAPEHNPELGPGSQFPSLPEPVPVCQVSLAGLSMFPWRPPGPDSRRDARPGAARDRGPSSTQIRRRLRAASLELQAGAGAAGAFVAVRDVLVEVADWRDLAAAGSSGSAQMPGFPREVRTDLALPSLEVRCSRRALEALAVLAADAAAPALVPLDALPADARLLHWRDPSAAAAAEAARAKQARQPAAKLRAAGASAALAAPFGADARAEVADFASAVAQRGASSAMKTASAAGTMAKDAASKMTKESATVAATSAWKKAEVAGAAAQRGAAAAATSARAGATVAAAAARDAAQKSATGALATATAAAAAGKQVVAGGQAMNAAGKALGVAGNFLRRARVPPAASLAAAAADAAPGRSAHQRQAEAEEEEEERQMRLAIARSLEDARGQPCASDASAAEDGASLGSACAPEGPALGDPAAGPPAPAALAAPAGGEGGADSVGAPEADAPAGSEGSAEDDVEDDEEPEEEEAGDPGAEAEPAAGAGPAAARGPDHPAASTALGAGPPPLARRLAVHVAVAAVAVEVTLVGDDGALPAALRLDLQLLDFSLEELRELLLPELRCLERLSLAPLGAAAAAAARRRACAAAGGGDEGSVGGAVAEAAGAPAAAGAPGAAEPPEAAAPPAIGGHYCATLGSAELCLVPRGDDPNGAPPPPQRVLWTDDGCGAAWLLTARWSTGAPASGPPAVRACLHGARAAAEPEAVRAIEGLVRAVLAALPPGAGEGDGAGAGAAGAVGAAEAAGHPAGLLPAPGAAARQAPAAPDVHITCRNVCVDLGPAAPLRPLAVLLPRAVAAAVSAEAAAAGPFGLCRLPPVPAWHAAPSRSEGRAGADARVYGCACARDRTLLASAAGDGGAAAGDAIVAERQWRPATQPAAPEVFLPAAEFMALSGAKLQGMELRASLAEHEAWRDARSEGEGEPAAQEVSRRAAMVRELMRDAGGGARGELDRQVAALQAEVEHLEEELEEDEVRLQTCEREAPVAVAKVRADAHAREAELADQLEEERAITRALAELVDEQAAALSWLGRRCSAEAASAPAASAASAADPPPAGVGAPPSAAG